MFYIYVDGSRKGVVVSCGMAIVDECNMVETYSSYKLMMEAESMFAEYYAIHEALRWLMHNNRKNAIIFTDNVHFFSMFSKEDGNYVLKKPLDMAPESIRPLISAIHMKIYELQKIKKGRIIVQSLEEKNEKDIFYHNIAHVESRKYLHDDNKLYTDYSKILFAADSFSKKIMNHTKVFNEIGSKDSAKEESDLLDSKEKKAE